MYSYTIHPIAMKLEKWSSTLLWRGILHPGAVKYISQIPFIYSLITISQKYKTYEHEICISLMILMCNRKGLSEICILKRCITRILRFVMEIGIFMVAMAINYNFKLLK